MATLAQILPRKFPNHPFDRIGEADTYSTIEWSSGAPNPLPTEAEIRAYSAQVDAEMAADDAKAAQQDRLYGSAPDGILILVEKFAAQLEKVRTGAPVAGLVVNWDELDEIQAILTEARG